jgi:hypothetical protein
MARRPSRITSTIFVLVMSLFLSRCLRPNPQTKPFLRPLSPSPVPQKPQQFSAKHEQKLDCGGGYIKLMPSTSDMKTFGGNTPYSIMFGPDICGYSTKRVHAIFTYNGKNLLTKQTIPCETDELTHVYTMVRAVDGSNPAPRLYRTGVQLLNPVYP